MSTYLVTGGTGLTGQYVLRELIGRGLDASEIVAYDLNPREENIEDVRGEFILVRGDVTDETRLESAFEEHRPNHVIHLAALVTHQTWETPTRALEVNCLGSNNVFEAANRYDAETCVYASSISVYGTADAFSWKESPPTVDEDDPVKPESPYGATKYVNEVMANTFSEKYDTTYYGVRLGGIWGRGRLFGGTGQFNQFVQDAGLGKEATVPRLWDAHEEINLSYGKDVGWWLVDLCRKRGLPRNVYNQGNEEPFTMDDVVAVLERLVPEAEIERPTEPEDETWIDPIVAPNLDCSRWYEEVGFTQEWDLESAIEDFVNYHREREGLEEVSL